MKYSWILATLGAAGSFATDWIVPGAKWHDTDGNIIDAHGGQVLQQGSTFYWVGHNRAGNATQYGDVTPVLYSSTDLTNWKFVGEIAPGFYAIWRPKIAKPNNKFYVYGQKSRWVQVGKSCSIEGNYKNVTRQSLPPNGWGYSDTGMFYDDSTSTYYILTSAQSNNVQINRITSEGLVGSRVSNLGAGPLEAPGILKADGVYYLIVSGKTGYRHNPNKVYYAMSISGPWSGGTDIAPPDTNTYNSQNTHEFTIAGTTTTTHIYMGDRWTRDGGYGSTYVWLPITVNSDNNTLALQWHDRWAVDVVTGVVSYPISKRRYEAEDAQLHGRAVIKSCTLCVSKRSVHQIAGGPSEVTFKNVLGNGASQWISLHYMAQRPHAGDAYISVNNQYSVNVSSINSNAGIHKSVPLQVNLGIGEVNNITFGIWGADYEVEMDGLEIFQDDFESKI